MSIDNRDPRDTRINAPNECNHDWKPVTMETTYMVSSWPDSSILDQVVPGPHPNVAKVYMVCINCACWTYMTAQWVGYRLYGSEDPLQEQSEGASLQLPFDGKIPSARYRKAWHYKE